MKDTFIMQGIVTGLVVIGLIVILGLTGCKKGNQKAEPSKEGVSERPQLETIDPILYGGYSYFARHCKLYRVPQDGPHYTEEQIFTPPAKLLTHCISDGDDLTPALIQKGSFFIFTIKRQAIGAGAAMPERYRSKDFKIWEEFIGTDWKAGAAQEAWRRL